MEAESQSDLVKPALVVKERVEAATGLPGVKGGGAHGKSSWELGRPRQRVKNRLDAGNHNGIEAG